MLRMKKGQLLLLPLTQKEKEKYTHNEKTINTKSSYVGPAYVLLSTEEYDVGSVVFLPEYCFLQRNFSYAGKDLIVATPDMVEFEIHLRSIPEENRLDVSTLPKEIQELVHASEATYKETFY